MSRRAPRGAGRALAVAPIALAALLAAAAAARAAPTARCFRRPNVRGIDVSKWQGEVDWPAVRLAGIRFAFIRASDGAAIRDPSFARNWLAARDAGILRGAYQYFRPEEDPEAQADLLLEIMGPPRAGDLPPALDIEVSGDVPPRELIRRVARWTRRIRRATGLRPIVYTSAAHWSSLAGDSRRFRSHPLWIAHHGAPCPSTPAAWRRWTFHQFSASSSIPGIDRPVDENYFRGTPRALRRLTASSTRAAASRYRRWQRLAAAGRDRRERAASSASAE